MLRIVGDKPQCGKLICGLKVNLVGFVAFVISGALAGLMGVLLVGYAGQTTMKHGGKLYACSHWPRSPIGGTHLAGGKGKLCKRCVGCHCTDHIETAYSRQ